MGTNSFLSIPLCLVLFALAQCQDKDSGLSGGLFPYGVENDLSSPDGGGGHRANPTDFQVGHLPLPPNYNRLVIPLGNISTSMYCFVHLSIRGILDVDNANGIVELDTEMGIQWIDWKIWDYLVSNASIREEVKQKSGTGPDGELILDSEFLRSIWKPDIYIEEMASVERTSLLSRLVKLGYLLENEALPGTMTFTARQTFKVRCSMEFQYYPADIQNCSFHIRSYGYTQEQVFLAWNPRQNVTLGDPTDPNYSFQVAGVEPGNNLYELFTTEQAPCCNERNFSTLSFDILIRRDLRYHLVQTCLPSILLVFITWLCFLLPPDMIEARIGISMTTLLTLTALFAAVRDQAPDVSYPMAIDIWMVFCIFFLFIALLIFTVLYWMRRRLESAKDKAKEEELVNEGEVPLKEEEVENFKRIAGHMMHYTFVIFAITFIIFLVVFPVWLLSSSAYLDWDPSPKYNSQTGRAEDKPLSALQERSFSEKQKSKVVKSLFRFYRLQKDVIGPKLREIEFAKGEGEEEEEEEEEESVETTTGVEGLPLQVMDTTPPQRNEALDGLSTPRPSFKNKTQ